MSIVSFLKSTLFPHRYQSPARSTFDLATFAAHSFIGKYMGFCEVRCNLLQVKHKYMSFVSGRGAAGT